MGSIRLGGVEGGGSKFLAAVAEPTDGAPVIIETVRVATTDPAATLGPIAEFLAAHEPDAVGIAAFGPLDLATGTLRRTPKAGWSGAGVLAPILEGLSVGLPARIDTDVNGAALGEWKWGRAAGASVAVYVTVGTGIGGGAVIHGETLRSAGHPEMGHVAVPRHPDDDYPGRCPMHRDCLEGMAAAPALEDRAGGSLQDLADQDSLWELAAHYLAHGLADITLVVAPEVIVLGGGVMQRAGLLEAVSGRIEDLLGDYVPSPNIVAPAFGQEAGLFGALALAETALSGGPDQK